MLVRRWLAGAAAVMYLAMSAVLSGCVGEASSHRGPAPEFVGIHGWVNSEPLTMAGLRGKVVLIEFWTYRCINCIRVMPHVVNWNRKYRGDGLVVIGVHSPETEEERRAEGLRPAMQHFGIDFPVALDNDFRTWDAYSNQVWPATYVIDRKGRIVRRHLGEGDYDETEVAIREALADRR
jgi:thiol-disulfide isomerase/thioredoxin